MNLSEKAVQFATNIMDKYRQQLEKPGKFMPDQPYYYNPIHTAIALAYDRGARNFYESGTQIKMDGEEGHSTILFADVAEQLGGKLHTTNILPESEIPAKVLGTRNIYFHQQQSDRFLASWHETIDFFYLDAGFRDGMDALLEVEHVNRLSNSHSILLIDDWDSECRVLPYHGKGRLSVPWYITHGWYPVEKGYEILMVRDK